MKTVNNMNNLDLPVLGTVLACADSVFTMPSGVRALRIHKEAEVWRVLPLGAKAGLYVFIKNDNPNLTEVRITETFSTVAFAEPVWN